MARTLTLVLGTLALLGGCGGDDSGGPGKPSPIAISVNAEGEELQLYQAVARAYEATGKPKVTVNTIADRPDFLAKLTTSFSAKRPPDAFLINHRYLGGYAKRNVLEPVGPRLGDAADDFYPVALDAFRFGGELTCVPQNTSSLVVYYNASMLEQLGVPAPAAGWTLDDLRDAARKLTSGKRHGVGLAQAVIRAAPFVWTAGGALVDDDEKPTRFTLDAPNARRGLEAMLSLAPYGPSRKEAASKALDERFLWGLLAMFLSLRREVRGVPDDQRLRMGCRGISRTRGRRGRHDRPAQRRLVPAEGPARRCSVGVHPLRDGQGGRGDPRPRRAHGSVARGRRRVLRLPRRRQAAALQPGVRRRARPHEAPTDGRELGTGRGEGEPRPGGGVLRWAYPSTTRSSGSRTKPRAASDRPRAGSPRGGTELRRHPGARRPGPRARRRRADGRRRAVQLGKSTLLRAIAGLESLDEGSIELDGRDVTRMAPADRGVAMVFQGFALFPHLSILDNIAFGLAARGTPPRRATRARG